MTFPKFEYQTLKATGLLSAQQLNSDELGGAGWELVDVVVDYKNQFWYYFKRPIEIREEKRTEK